MIKNKVWIIQDKGSMSFEDAKRFGEPTILFKQGTNPFNIKALYFKARDIFKKANNEDWLLLCGNQTMNGMAVLAFEHTFSRLNFLIFDAKTSKYVPRNIEFETIESSQT